MVDESTHFKAYLLTEKRVALTTYKAYSADIDTFILYANQKIKKKISELSDKDIEDFFKHLKARGLSQSSIIRCAATLRSFGRYLNARKELTTPLLSIKISGKATVLPSSCSEKDMAILLLVYNPEKEQRNNLIMNLLYATGMRVSELCKLEIQDICLETQTIRISGKRGKHRVVPLTPDISLLIKEYIQGSRLNTIAQKQQFSTPFLFPIIRKRSTAPITRTMVWKIVKKSFIRAISNHQNALTLTHDNVFPHMFRHALASHLIKYDWDLRSIQLMLGHEQITTVQTYLTLDTSRIKKIYTQYHPRSPRA